MLNFTFDIKEQKKKAQIQLQTVRFSIKDLLKELNSITEKNGADKRLPKLFSQKEKLLKEEYNLITFLKS